MRLHLLVLAFGATLSGCQCSPSFVTQIQGQLTIPAVPPGTLTTFPPVAGLTNVDFNLDPDFINEGVTKDTVTGAVAESAALQITNPASQDFKFLDNLQLVAKAGNQEAVFAQKSSIGQINIPLPNPVLTMDTTGVQLKPYVAATSMSVVVRGSGMTPPADTQILIKISMEIKVK
jgi:hypothetical protein